MADTPYNGGGNRDTWEKHGERVSVRDFFPALGGASDGVTDCLAAFQAAYDAIVAKGGGTIDIPGVGTVGGAYLLSGSVVMASDVPVTWRGHGKSSKVIRGGALAGGAGLFDIQAATNITFKNILIDGDVTTPTGLTYGDIVTGSDADPMHALLTQDTSVWIHASSKNISFVGVHWSHSGGYAVLINADSADVSDITFDGCWFTNNRPHLFGTSGGDLNYGSWTGGIFYRGDCTSGNPYAVRNLTIRNSHWRRNTGNCIWGHCLDFETQHTNITIENCDFEDCGLDAVLMGNVDGGAVRNVNVRRVGYITLTDSDTPNPRYLTGVNATGIDNSGWVRHVDYANIEVVSHNGGAYDLDGCRDCNYSNLNWSIPASGTPQYTEDSISLYGPNQDGTLRGRGINSGNTSQNGGGWNLIFNGLRGSGTGRAALLLGYGKRCRVSNFHFEAPSGALEPPIILYSASGGSGDELLNYDNTIENGTIEYTGAAYCVEEQGAGWDPAHVNRVFNLAITGTNAGAFLANATTASFQGFSIEHDGESLAAKHNGIVITCAPGTAGVAVVDGFIQSTQGFAAVGSSLTYNAIQAPAGGMLAISASLTGYSLWASQPSPTPTSGDSFLNHGVMNYDHGSTLFRLRYGTSSTVLADAFVLAAGYSASGTAANSIDVPNGGASAKWLVATDSLFLIELGSAPALSASGQARLYADAATHSILASINGGAYSGFGGGGSVAGSNTQIQYNNSGAFGASSSFTWNNSTKLLAITTGSGAAGIDVSGGYIQSAQGFLAVGASATNYNSIQAPAGGFAGKNCSLTDYALFAAKASISAITGDSFTLKAILWQDSASGFLRLTYGGGSTGGTFQVGGLYCTGTAYNSIQVPLGGVHALSFFSERNDADSHIIFNRTTSVAAQWGLAMTTSGDFAITNRSSSFHAFYVIKQSTAAATAVYTDGYFQSPVGFLTTGTSYQTFNGGSGGSYANSHRSIAYTQVGQSSGTPSATTGDSLVDGCLYYDTSANVFKGRISGSFQTIGSATAPLFTGTNTGTSFTFINNNGNFSVNGNGDVGAVGQFTLVVSSVIRWQATASSSVFKDSGGTIQASVNHTNGAISATNGFYVSAGSLQVINSSGAFISSGGINVGSAGISCGNYNLNGGYIGQTVTFNAFPTQMVFRGGILVSYTP